METQNIHLIGVPLDCGKTRIGCMMGPDSYRTAGLEAELTKLGHTVTDQGNISIDFDGIEPDLHPHAMNETIAWTREIATHAQKAMEQGFPVFLGGDHALALGSVSGIAAYAETVDRPLFILWLDAHSDFHSPQTTASGNLHGTPLAYVTGQDGFDIFPPLAAIQPTKNICLMGIRSIDAQESVALQRTDINVVGMRTIDEIGIAKPLTSFLNEVIAADGFLHVSLDVDFLDPDIAPAVGTTVPGGATFREAHLVMELLCDSGRVTSLDLVELNPFLDERGRTAKLMVDLCASLMGRRIFDRPTRSY